MNRKYNILILILISIMTLIPLSGCKKKKPELRQPTMNKYTVTIKSDYDQTELAKKLDVFLKNNGGEFDNLKKSGDNFILKYSAKKELIKSGQEFINPYKSEVKEDKKEEKVDSKQKPKVSSTQPGAVFIYIKSYYDKDTFTNKLNELSKVDNKFRKPELKEITTGKPNTYQVIIEASTEVVDNNYEKWGKFLDGDQEVKSENESVTYKDGIATFKISNNTERSDFKEFLNALKSEYSEIQDIKIREYSLNIDKDKTNYTYLLEIRVDKNVGNKNMDKWVEYLKNPINKDNQEKDNKDNKDNKDDKDNKDNKDDKDNNENKGKVEETKPIENTKADYSKFVNESYESVFRYWLNNRNGSLVLEKEALVYSPFSYKKALEGLGRITDDFNLDKYLGNAILSKLPDKLNNITTGNKVMLNKYQFESVEDESIKLLEFPKEAEEESESLQKEVLGEVLLKPEYDKEMSAVIVNATRFYGKWETSFNKKKTKKDIFKTLDGKESEKDIMCGKIDNYGFEDDKVTIGRKRLKEDNSYVYFIEPKDNDKESLIEISKNINSYINKFNNNEVKEYEEVNLLTPRLDIKSNIDILKSELEYGRKFGLFKEKPTIKRIKEMNIDRMSISSIQQVAKMKMDEEEVEAKAVTEIVAVTMALPLEDKDTLTVDCRKPHFVVTVSNGVISFIAFIAE